MGKEINYIGENLFLGNLGYFFVVLSFGCAIFGMISYFFYSCNESIASWKTFGRAAFMVHGVAVIGIFATLFYIIYTHSFQYNYAWSHSSRDLPTHYIISCFWEGQEGSFLLWTFWQFVLGVILILTSKRWEGPVMTVLCFAQVMLASMLLGMDEVKLLGTAFHLPIKLGSNPFILLRQAFPQLPLFTSPDYVNKIADGRGLNALLQNYWMVIHPPVLFLGFASTIVPFCFAMGGIWRREYGAWIKPALPWALFNGMILGTGILMGGAWAYEALSFGGFWAWDPVENASLVPWLIMIAGLHTMLIYHRRKTSLGAAYILVTLGYLLILYSTFLTRSGILGDSSVHSFTDLGLSGQLLIFMFAFVFVALFVLIRHWKQIPKTEQEENVYSREFWMFIGALILSLSALHIIVLTSIPVINKISGLVNTIFHSHLKTNLSKPADPIATYHQLQIPFAIIIALLTGFGQFFKFFKTNPQEFWRRAVVSVMISIPAAMLVAYLLELKDFRLVILLWASFFTITGNADILFSFLRRNRLSAAGAAIAHIGIGFILLGALIANGKKQTISINTEHFEALENASAKEQMENKVLYKDFPVKMYDYTVVYRGDSMDKNHVYYKINYKRVNASLNDTTEKFDLFPYLVYDKNKDQMSATSPATRHYLTRDIFTHITAASNNKDTDYQVKYDTFFVKHVHKGETFRLDSFRITLQDIILEQGDKSAAKDKYRVGMKLKATDGFYTYYANPSFTIEGNTLVPTESEIHEFGLKFFYRSLDPKTQFHEIVILQGKRPAPQFIALKAIIFPFINLLWIGSVIMIIGFAISIYHKIKETGKAN
jgi:cytochrome c-type biogenesis protein CcmF